AGGIDRALTFPLGYGDDVELAWSRDLLQDGIPNESRLAAKDLMRGIDSLQELFTRGLGYDKFVHAIDSCAFGHGTPNVVVGLSSSFLSFSTPTSTNVDLCLRPKAR